MDVKMKEFLMTAWAQRTELTGSKTNNRMTTTFQEGGNAKLLKEFEFEYGHTHMWRKKISNLTLDLAFKQVKTPKPVRV